MNVTTISNLKFILRLFKVGEYVCRAVNSEGVGESGPVPLKIMCEYGDRKCSHRTCVRTGVGSECHQESASSV